MVAQLARGRSGWKGSRQPDASARDSAPNATSPRGAGRVHRPGVGGRSGRRVARLLLALLPALLPALVGCGERSPAEPDPPPRELLASYVALGNSITAGFQSEGINRDTQRESYAVLLAERMGVEFNVPELQLPGCPPPLVDGLTRERLGGGGAPLCSFRRIPLPAVVHNVAVPGARVGDVLTSDGGASSPNPLQLLLLAGLTQIEAARRAEPTFASLWIGNNDVLSAALSGVAGPGRVTPLEEFRVHYRQILDELEQAGALGGALLGVGDVTLIPYLSAGEEYWSAARDGRLPAGVGVASSCAPAEEGGIGGETLVPFGFAFEELASRAEAGDEATLDCAAAERVLQPSEIAFIRETIREYNRFIEEEAAARGWVFYDPNPSFRALADAGAVPSFPLVDRPGELFGPLFSLDGVHPARAAHRLVAAELVEAINAHYEAGLAPIDAGVAAAPAVTRRGR